MWTLLLWPRPKPLIHRFVLSSPHLPLPLLWKPFHSQTPLTLSIVTLPLALNVLWFHSLGDAPYSTPSMHCRTPVSVPRKNSSPLALFGRVSTQMFVVGLARASSVNVQRSGDTPKLHYPHIPPPMLVSTSSTLILSDPYRHPGDSPTSSPALTATLAGRKPFPSPPSQLKLWLRLSSVGGFLVLVFPQPSSRIVDANSNPNSGTPS